MSEAPKSERTHLGRSTAPLPAWLSLSSLKSGVVLNQPSDGVTRHFSRAAGHSWQSGSALLHGGLSGDVGSHKFGRLIIFLHPLWNHYGLWKKGRQAAQITAYFFPVPRPPAAHSSARHAKNDAMRCAFVQRSQFARASRPLPLSLSPSLLASVPRRAALINRGAQTSGSAAAAVRIRRSRSFAFTVAAFLNTVTVRK